MAPEYTIDVERRGVEALGDGRDSRRHYKQKHRIGIDKATYQPWAGDTVDLRPLRVTQTVRPLSSRGGSLSVRMRISLAFRHASKPPSSVWAAMPSCLNHAAVPSLNFCPRWQTTMTLLPRYSGAQLPMARWSRRSDPGTSLGSAP